MSAPTQTPYADTAYRSTCQQPLPVPDSRAGHRQPLLAFGHYACLEPAMEITAQLQADEHHIYQRQKVQGKPQEAYCDARRWRFQNTSKIPHLLYISKLMAFFFIWTFWGAGLTVALMPETNRRDLDETLALLSSLITVVLMIISLAGYMNGKKGIHALLLTGFVILCAVVYVQQGALWGADDSQVALWCGAFLYFMGAIGCDVLLWIYSRISSHDGSEFNRTDGMLRFKRRFRSHFVAPFDEFDPVMKRLSSGYGSHDYALWLYHRYSANRICLAVKVHALGLDRPNVLAFWDCLQRYMDVTQPLPDLPVLEQSRHLDPVTCASDVLTGRAAGRWQHQSEKAWLTEGLPDLTRKLHLYPWQEKPCIVRARIDPSLTFKDSARA